MRNGNLHAHTWVEAEDGSEYRLDVEVTPGRPAKLYGLPENCHPAEPSELADCTLSGPIEGSKTTGPAVAWGEEDIAKFLKEIGADETFEALCEQAFVDAEPEWPEYEREG